MKVSIVKLANGNVKFTIATATDKKPMVSELTPTMLEVLLGMLKQAATAERFEFTLAL